MKTIAHGAIGLAKAALRLDRPAEAVIAGRREICRQCEHATHNDDPRFARFNGLTRRSKCEVCQCNISAKTAVRSESCPLGKWTSQQDGAGQVEDTADRQDGQG